MSFSLFSKKSIVGIDIGHNAIKVAQVEKVGPAWKITAVASCPTPHDTVKEGQIYDPDTVGIAIKTLLRNSRINATTSVLGVSSSSVIVRSVRMAKMNEETLRKSIRYEAGRYVPTSADDSYIDFQIMDQLPDGQMEVQMVAAPKTLINSRIRAVECADLDVEAVDVDAFAMHRSLIETDESNALNNMTVAIVDIGAMLTTVSVANRGAFSMVRTISQGGQTWTDALKTYFKLTDEDAESGKAQLDLTHLLQEPQPENPPLRVMQPHVDDLVREVRRSLNYYQSQQSEIGQANPVTHLVVGGGSARIGGIAAYFSNKLGIPAMCRGIFDNPKVLAPAGPSGTQGLELSVASGLAMRSFIQAA